jgi:hypothetical protein
MKDDYDDIEILDIGRKKKIPSDETEVLDPVVVKKSINKEVLNRSGSEYAKKVELPSRTSLREQEEKKTVKKDSQELKTTKKGKKSKSKKPAKTWEKIFWGISLAFILGCCIFYGRRLIKYYKIYNPTDPAGNKVELLGDRITGRSEFVYEGSGLYNNETGYVYKGEVDNNYIVYNNLVWRILRINTDKSMVIILEDSMTMLPWNDKSVNYKDSDIHRYLNNEFLNNLDKSYLVKNSFCEDSVENLTSISCEKKDSESYVSLLDISTFLNSIVDKESYLVDDWDSIFWLNNYSSDKVWHTNEVNISQSDANSFYGVRPVVKLKSTIPYVSGDGTKDNPYLTENEKDSKLALGSKVKLGDDTWIVYDTSNNSTKLMLAKTLDKTYRYDLDKLTYDKDSKSSLAEYLNTEYLEGLSYKDYLKEDEWVTGGYTSSLEDIKKNTVKAKVGTPSLLDYQFDSSVKGYFTTTSQEEYILVYDNPLHASKPTISRGIRPCISLTDDAVKKLKLNDGLYAMGD